MAQRRVFITLALAALLALPALAGARRYRGERVDVITGQQLGRWIIRTRERDGGQTLRTVVRCRPRRRCRPFPGRLRIDMQPGADELSWSGSFTLSGVTCLLQAYVYESGFEGTYNCDDGSFGSISGRAAARSGRNGRRPYAAP